MLIEYAIHELPVFPESIVMNVMCRLCILGFCIKVEYNL